MHSHLGVVAQVFEQLRRYSNELTMFLYIEWHGPVGDRLYLFGIIEYAMFTHNSYKKWYFASR